MQKVPLVYMAEINNFEPHSARLSRGPQMHRSGSVTLRAVFESELAPKSERRNTCYDALLRCYARAENKTKSTISTVTRAVTHLPVSQIRRELAFKLSV
jgi:hypothetical protein